MNDKNLFAQSDFDELFTGISTFPYLKDIWAEGFDSRDVNYRNNKIFRASCKISQEFN